MTLAGNKNIGGASRRLWLDSAASVAMILAAAVMIATALTRVATGRNPRPSRVVSEPLSLEGASLKGDPGATVGLVVYSDFECPYCAAFALNILPRLDHEYIGRGLLLVAFRHLPLEQVHPFAFRAAVASECAGRAGKFWEMHDLLFEGRDNLTDAALSRRAQRLQLEPAEFASCVKGLTAEKVRRDAWEAKQVGIVATPSFVIGTLDAHRRIRPTQQLSGATAFEVLAAAIDNALAGRGATTR